MKHFRFLLFCASYVFSLWLGSPVRANSTPEFIDRSQIALSQSPADSDSQRQAEQQLRDNNQQGISNPPIERVPLNSSEPQEQTEQERQRQAERDLKERQAREQRERDARERRERRERESYYPSYQSPSSSPGIIIEQPQVYPTTETTSPSPGYNPGYETNQTNRNRRGGTISVSTGFNGSVNPAIGYRLPNSNIGFEIGAVFNQDSLPPGTTSDPNGSLIQQFPNGFNDVGVKNTTPNIGGDIIGYYDVSPQVTLHGGVGIYFQGRSQIIQSKVTTDLFETTRTTTSFAVSGGADFRVSDSVRIGAGYHSLRGVTAKIGIEF